MIKILNISALIIILSACAPVKKVDWISTTNDHPWIINNPVSLKKGAATDAKIVIRSDQTRQTVDGFGGCFNELGWEALNILNGE